MGVEREQAAGAAAAGLSTEHTDILRAARDAQRRAQELFDVASDARSAATEQAEQVISEARAAAEQLLDDARRDAERSRNELTRWAAKQRAEIEALVEDVLNSARKDADAIRAEALSSAMADAEETARLYVGEAAARGARDAEAIRATARDTLTEARVLASGVTGTVRDLSESLAAVQARIQGGVAGMGQLLDALADGSANRADTAAGPDEPRELGAMFRDAEAAETAGETSTDGQ